MALSRDEVRHIALLARLALSAAEEAAFTEQLGHILEHFEKLDGLDTGAVEPTAHVVDLMARRIATTWSPTRPPPEALRANARRATGNFFKVPKIIE